MSMWPQISKIDSRTKKIQTSRHFKKMHIKKVLVELKRRKQVENIAVFVELKRKNMSRIRKKTFYLQFCMETPKGHQESIFNTSKVKNIYVIQRSLQLQNVITRDMTL
jgi:hypothetical protein